MFLTAHSDIIPIKFQSFAGVTDHDFRIVNDRYFANEQQGVYIIKILIDCVWKTVALPINKYPNQIEALAILSELDGESERQGRYINVYAAYEAVVNEQKVEYSSIRHALAHPITKLTRPKVNKSLEKRFGGLSIDLRNYQHQKEFYRCIGQMLIEIEVAIYEKISEEELV